MPIVKIPDELDCLGFYLFVDAKKYSRIKKSLYLAERTTISST